MGHRPSAVHFVVGHLVVGPQFFTLVGHNHFYPADHVVVLLQYLVLQPRLARGLNHLVGTDCSEILMALRHIRPIDGLPCLVDQCHCLVACAGEQQVAYLLRQFGQQLGGDVLLRVYELRFQLRAVA